MDNVLLCIEIGADEKAIERSDNFTWKMTAEDPVFKIQWLEPSLEWNRIVAMEEVGLTEPKVAVIIVNWHRAWQEGKDMSAFSLSQIDDYVGARVV